MNTTFENESDALSTSSGKPTTAQDAAITPPHTENKEAPAPNKDKSAAAEEGTPVPTEGNGTPDYSHIEIKTESDLPTPDKAGGSATAPESGGGYSG